MSVFYRLRFQQLACIGLSGLLAGIGLLRGQEPADDANDGVLRRLSSAIEAEPQDVPALLERGHYYLWRLFDFEKALQDFNRAIELDPEIAPAYIGRADVYTGQDLRYYDPKKGLADAEKALSLAPDLSEAHRIRGDIPSHKGMGKFEDGLPYYRKALELDGNNLLALLGSASIHADESASVHDLTKALAFATRALETAPKESLAQQTMADLLTLSPQTKPRALDFYDRAIDLNPYNAGAYLSRAYFLLSEGMEQEAEKILRHMAEDERFADPIEMIRGTNAALFDDALETLGDESRIGRALRDLEEAAKRLPHDEDAYLTRALILRNFPGLERRALEDYDQAVAKNSRNAETLLLRVEFLIDNPQLLISPEAVDDLDPEDTGALLEQLREPLAEGTAELLEDCNKAIELEPEKAHAYFLRGTLKASQNAYEEAVADMTTAIRLSPDNQAYYEARADIHETFGRDDEAEADREKSASLNAID